MLVFRKGSGKDLNFNYGLFLDCHPKEEVLPEIVLQKAIFNKKAEFLMLVDDEVKVCVAEALVLPGSVYGYGMLLYFGTMPWYKDRGFEEELVRSVIHQYGYLNGLFIQIPTQFTNEQIQLREQTAKRFGFDPMNVQGYSFRNIEMKLMMRNLARKEDVSPYMHLIIPDIFEAFMTSATVARIIQFQ
jgi:hypothetical protein